MEINPAGVNVPILKDGLRPTGSIFFEGAIEDIALFCAEHEVGFLDKRGKRLGKPFTDYAFWSPVLDFRLLLFQSFELEAATRYKSRRKTECLCICRSTTTVSMDFSPPVLLAQQRSGAVSCPPWSIHSDGPISRKIRLERI
jgi:hypothetical protein